MPSINLAPGTQYIVAARKRRKRMVLSSFVVLTITGIIWGGLFWYRGNLRAQQEEVDARIRTINMEIARLEESADRVVLFEDRLEALDTLLDRHVSLNPLLLGIEQLLPPEVVLDALNIDAEKGVVLASGSTGNMDKVAEVLASFQGGANTVFNQVDLGRVERIAQRDEDGVQTGEVYNFGMELTFDPSILTEGS